RAILRADVVALPHPLRRIVIFPEHLQQVFVPDLLRIEHDEDDLSVIRRPAADLAVCRILRVTRRVADGRGVHTGLLPELLLSAPEAAHAEQRDLRSLGKRRLDWMLVHEMRSHLSSFPGFAGVKSSAAPFMQYRRPVGCGPSGNT